MNEASSKYVDQIATQRLIQDKLRRVHHAPDRRGWREDERFAELDLPARPERATETRRGRAIELSFSSAIHTENCENDLVRCLCFPSTRPAADLILVHGLYEDNLDIYSYLVSMLNEQGMNVYLLVLPYHYDRKPAGSLFSGEFFWSANVHRSVLAFRQAVSDLYQLYGHVRSRVERPVWIAGFSMGGGIVLSLAARAVLEGAFVINPVCNLSELVWTSALFATIREDLEANGITFAEVKAWYSPYEPLNAGSIRTDVARIALARGLYDQINDANNYDLLIARWKIPRILNYKAGHLNILRVPRLAADIYQFFVEGPSR